MLAASSAVELLRVMIILSIVRFSFWIAEIIAVHGLYRLYQFLGNIQGATLGETHLGFDFSNAYTQYRL
jgi:hypothetical protein